MAQEGRLQRAGGEPEWDGAEAVSKAGSKLALVGTQLVLTTAADKGGMFRKARSPRTVAIPIGRAHLRTDKFGNAWVYDGDEIIEVLEACQPIAALEEIARTLERAKPQLAEADREAEKGATQAAKRPQVWVVRYKTTRDYQRDAERRVAAGWRIASQSQETGRTHRLSRATRGAFIGGLFMMPTLGAAIGGLSGKRDEGPITVTWTKDPDPFSTEKAKPQEESAVGDVLDQLRKLGELRDAGVITGQDFDAKKAELLARM